jgi:hypothetical protein
VVGGGGKGEDWFRVPAFFHKIRKVIQQTASKPHALLPVSPQVRLSNESFSRPTLEYC